MVSEGRDNSESTSEESRDQGCIVRTRSGDREAFNELIDRYSARIYRHLYRRVRSREEAEDLTQETFLRAYRYLDRYDASRPFRSWLYTIATNLGRNAMRAQQRRGYALRIDDETYSQRKEIVAKEKTLRDATRAELRERLAKAVDRLPETSSMLIQLHYSEHLTVREAAEILGLTESAAKVALHRARKSLREMFTKETES